MYMTNLTPYFAAVGGTTLNGLDWLAIACYFGVLLCVAWWVVAQRKDTASDYFLASARKHIGRHKLTAKNENVSKYSSNNY
jgi:hypothetical protein